MIVDRITFRMAKNMNLSADFTLGKDSSDNFKTIGREENLKTHSP